MTEKEDIEYTKAYTKQHPWESLIRNCLHCVSTLVTSPKKNRQAFIKHKAFVLYFVIKEDGMIGWGIAHADKKELYEHTPNLKKQLGDK